MFHAILPSLPFLLPIVMSFVGVKRLAAPARVPRPVSPLACRRPVNRASGTH
jgi:hypothetical protein